MGIRVPIEEASAFGVIVTSDDDPTRIADFVEKPTDPKPIPGDPDHVFASMGNYIFDAETLVDAVSRDAQLEDSKHDMGGNIVTELVERGEAAVYDFSSHVVPGETKRDHAYWRDVGTIDSYHAGNMDLIAVDPPFNLYNRQWPILTWRDPFPPAKFVHDFDDRRGTAVDSMVSEGVIISGGTVRRSVLSQRVRVHSRAEVVDSVLFDNVDVGEDALIRNAIIDKDVTVAPGARLGVDAEHDRDRGFHMSESGIVVVGKGEHVPS